MKTCLTCNIFAPDSETNCPKCGKPYARAAGEAARSPTQTPRPAQSKLGMLWLLLVAGLVVMLLPFLPDQTNGARMEKRTGSAVAPTHAETIPKISAKDLYRAYEANEVAADQRFKGVRVAVRGEIGSIGKDILGTAYVTLETGHILNSVQCMFPKSAESGLSSLVKGSTVTINGKVSGKMGNVILRDCSFF